MRFRFVRSPGTKSDPLQKITGLFLLPVFGLMGWVVACSPAVVDAPSARPRPYNFYLDTWTEDNAENRVVPLNPKTPADQPDGKTLKPGRFSSDGSTGVAAITSHEAEPTNGQYFDCPVTQPPKAPFIPPDPWPSQPPGTGQFWFGDSGLWAALPARGSWRQLALGEKFWWWSEEFDVAVDATPDLTVTARHLDGDTPAFQASEATNGYHESFNWAMLIGVDLTSPGCWEFTGQYKDHQLSFVLWVPPE